MALSCVLFHGPGARSAALAKATSIGRLIAPPFGEGGLKVEESRQIVELLLSTPVGEAVGTVVIGPLDEAVAKSTDGLLKMLEEFSGETTRPVLWAHDLGGVSSTIQSRCLAQWAAATFGGEEDDTVLTAAGTALDASFRGDRFAIVDAVKNLPKGKEKAFVAAMADQILTEISKPEARALWERFRAVTRWRNPTQIELVAALLPGA